MLLALLQIIAFEGATVHTQVPGEEPQIQTVLVEAGRILALGPDLEVPSEALGIDGAGLHLVPGLIDGMVHHDLQHDPLYLLSGVTLARDMGNDLGRIFMAAKQEVRDSMPGPELFICGAVFDGVPPATTESAVVRTAAEVDDKLPRMAENGAEFIAFHLGIPVPAWKRLIEVAHGEGLTAWGPLPRGVSRSEALAEGLDGLCYLEAFRDESGGLLAGEDLDAAIAEFAASDCALTPLLRVYEYRTEDPGEDPPGLALLAPYYGDWWLDDLARRRTAMAEEGYLARGAAEYAELAAIVAKLSEAGVALVPGSAAPNPWMLPGEALHDELAAFVAAGITPTKTLYHATFGAAEALGLEASRGSIRPGLVADLLLAKEDPRVSLESLRRPVGLMARGVWLDAKYLDDLRSTLLEVQREAHEKSRLPLDIEAPKLPEGTLVLHGRVESSALERVVAAEEYWVVRCFDGSTAWCSRMLTPEGLGVAPTEHTLVQRFVDEEFQSFELVVSSGDYRYRVEGLMIGGQFRIKRWMNDFYIDTNSSPRSPDFIDAGLALPVMILAHYPFKPTAHVVYFDNTEPALATWEWQLGDNGIYAVKTARGPLVATVEPNGALDKLARTEGNSALRSSSVKAESYGGPGLPPAKRKPLDVSASDRQDDP
jgi:fructose-specific component phosphotransferase system IIB-like protein